MNGCGYADIEDWSREYLIERYKDLVEIEKEHKKENGELRKRIEKLEMQLLEKGLHIDGLKEDRRIAIEEIQEQYFVSKNKIKEIIGELEKQGDWYIENKSLDDLYGKIDILQELLEERN